MVLLVDRAFGLRFKRHVGGPRNESRLQAANNFIAAIDFVTPSRLITRFRL